MKYMILIHGNPQSRQIWEGFSDAERAEGLKVYAALHADLVASGELIASEALADPSMGARVSLVDGRAVAGGGPVVGDGPFAEAKEHLAGFFLVDCEGMDRAIEIAGRVPEADMGLVEVVPILVYSGLEM